MRLLYLFAGLLFQGFVFSQSTTQLLNSDGKVIAAMSDINGAVVTTLRPTNVEGKPYLGGEWNRGAVYFKRGKWADSLYLQFDLTNNKLYFKQDGVMQSFLDEVEGFLLYPGDEEVKHDMIFRCGYPAAWPLNNSSFFEVLAAGKSYHLLKFRLAAINEVFVYNGQSKKSYTVASELYIYNSAAKEIHKIKPGKKNLVKAIPSLSAAIESLCRQNDWDIKDEAELALLVDALNGKK